MRAHLAAGIQRAVEARGAAARAGGNLCLAGGLGLERAAGFRAGTRSWARECLRAAGSGQCGNGDRRGAEHLAHGLPAGSARAAREPLAGPGTPPRRPSRLENCKLRFRYLLTTDEIVDTAVEQLTDNKIVAWMHGRMEFGPRALGNRSILASPLDPIPPRT
jgi:carbamoyltransferase